MKRAVLLLSSGLDSAANLALGSENRDDGGFTVSAALTIDYGQRGARRELEQAKKLAAHYAVEHVTFDLRGFSPLVGAGSALMGGQAMPSPKSLDDLAVTTASAAAVWVPNRNGVLLSIAAALAESRGHACVAVGFNAEEAVTFPDNTPAYMEAMTASLEFSTANKIKVVSATATLTKREIVERLAGSQFPFELLWSCYQAGESHCGICESCQRLRRALGSGLGAAERDRVSRSLFL